MLHEQYTWQAQVGGQEPGRTLSGCHQPVSWWELLAMQHCRKWCLGEDCWWYEVVKQCMQFSCFCPACCQQIGAHPHFAISDSIQYWSLTTVQLSRGFPKKFQTYNEKMFHFAFFHCSVATPFNHLCSLPTMATMPHILSCSTDPDGAELKGHHVS